MQKIKFIDGLRGWASLAVLIFHIFPCLIFQGIENPILSKMSFFGVRAVLIFFILSGFPLSIGLLKQQEREREREREKDALLRQKLFQDISGWQSRICVPHS